MSSSECDFFLPRRDFSALFAFNKIITYFFHQEGVKVKKYYIKELRLFFSIQGDELHINKGLFQQSLILTKLTKSKTIIKFFF